MIIPEALIFFKIFRGHAKLEYDGRMFREGHVQQEAALLDGARAAQKKGKLSYFSRLNHYPGVMCSSTWKRTTARCNFATISPKCNVMAIATPQLETTDPARHHHHHRRTRYFHLLSTRKQSVRI